MELIRNHHDLGKYLVIRTSGFDGPVTNAIELAEQIMKNPKCVVFGDMGSEDEFFVLMLKDKYSGAALRGYAAAAMADDIEYGKAVLDLADRAGENNIFVKKPD